MVVGVSLLLYGLFQEVYQADCGGEGVERGTGQATFVTAECNIVVLLLTHLLLRGFCKTRASGSTLCCRGLSRSCSRDAFARSQCAPVPSPFFIPVRY